ncbi:hypothetical protein RGZ1_279 [Morganella phage vB_MmoM_Rgz1]|nr:hypothetical protein RGZ1_279 [Morganella phage vB_MmoM_Rgz1]
MLVKHEGNKVNFIDRLDQYVGFDMSTICCEYADYEIYNDAGDIISNDTAFDEQLVFFCADIEVPDVLKDEINNLPLDSGGYIIFGLTGKNGYYYLVLSNCHNGYYAHTYNFRINDYTDRGSI